MSRHRANLLRQAAASGAVATDLCRQDIRRMGISATEAAKPALDAAQPRPAPLRVMLIANTGWNIIRFRMPLAEALVRHGCEILVVADFEPTQLAEAERPGVRAFALEIDAAGIDPRADLSYGIRLHRLIRRLRPDIVHLFTIKPIVYGTLGAKLAGTRGIVAALTGAGMAQTGRRRWLTAVVQGLLRLSFAGRTCAIFQNEADLAMFAGKRLMPADRAFLIPGSGIDTDQLSPEPSTGGTARKTFLMASRMLWSKGVGDFVQAARLVKAHYPDAEFVLFGGAKEDYGSKNPDFIDRTWLNDLNADGVVAWRGWTQPDIVEAAIRQAAAVVLPSTYGEGIPRSLIEASAAGVPIITTDTAGCRDAVLPAVSGFICRANAPKDLAAAMMELLRQPDMIARMGSAGRQLALERFDQEHIVKQTLQVYARALAAS